MKTKSKIMIFICLFFSIAFLTEVFCEDKELLDFEHTADDPEEVLKFRPEVEQEIRSLIDKIKEALSTILLENGEINLLKLYKFRIAHPDKIDPVIATLSKPQKASFRNRDIDNLKLLRNAVDEPGALFSEEEAVTSQNNFPEEQRRHIVESVKRIGNLVKPYRNKLYRLSGIIKGDYDIVFRNYVKELNKILIKYLGADKNFPKLPDLENLVHLHYDMNGNIDSSLKEIRQNIQKTLGKEDVAIIEDQDIDSLRHLSDSFKLTRPIYRDGNYQVISGDDYIQLEARLKTATRLAKLISKQKRTYLTTPDVYQLLQYLNIHQAQKILQILQDETHRIDEVDLKEQIKNLDEHLKTLLGAEKGKTKITELPIFRWYETLLKQYKDFIDLIVPSKQITQNDVLTAISTLYYLDLGISSYNPSTMTTYIANFIPLWRTNNTIEDIELFVSNLKKLIRTVSLACIEYLGNINPDLLESASEILFHKSRMASQKISHFLDKEEIWILTIDGGGIRGLLPAILLDEMSKKTGHSVSDLFDYFAGTSTGGIIVLALNTPKSHNLNKPAYDTDFIKNFYSDHGQLIFPSLATTVKKILQNLSSAYDPSYIEQLFIRIFGQHKLSDLIKPTIITAVDLYTGDSKIFRSHSAVESAKLNPELWQVARATSAAPTYFPPFTLIFDGHFHEFIDGGITMNNPTLAALNDILPMVRQINPVKVKKINIVSLGTGITTYQYHFGEKNTGFELAMRAYTSISPQFSAKNTDTTVRQFLRFLKGHELMQIEHHYYRINPRIENIQLDDASEENIKKIESVAKNVIASEQFQGMLRHLKESHDVKPLN